MPQIRAEAEMRVQEFVINIPKKREECFWTEHILIKEFNEKILMTTDRFIKEIVLINELLLAAKEVIELEIYIKKQKNQRSMSSAECQREGSCMGEYIHNSYMKSTEVGGALVTFVGALSTANHMFARAVPYGLLEVPIMEGVAVSATIIEK